jgi:hypothetical protein
MILYKACNCIGVEVSAIETVALEKHVSSLCYQPLDVDAIMDQEQGEGKIVLGMGKWGPGPPESDQENKNHHENALARDTDHISVDGQAYQRYL